MHLRLALTSLLILTSIRASFAADDNPEVNFDKGVDASAILGSARKLAAKQLTPIPPVDRKLCKLPKGIKASLGPGTYQPVSPLITGSEAYPLGANLRVDPKYLALDPSVQKPLEADWTDITAVRSDLLSQASTWDDDNERLYADGQQLEQDRIVLARRRSDLNAEITRYNQACTTRPLPPDEYQRCVAWRDSLLQRKSQLDNDVAQFNGRVNSWNQRSSAIFDRRRTLVELIEAWELRIRQWIETAKKAIEAVCRLVDYLESRPPQENVFTGGFSVPFEVRAIYKPEPKDAPPCPVDYLWSLQVHPPVPPGPLGFLSPVSGPKTSFTSGNYPGLGTVVVQDLNSGKGTGSTINVVNPSKK